MKTSERGATTVPAADIFEESASAGCLLSEYPVRHVMSEQSSEQLYLERSSNYAGDGKHVVLKIVN